MRKFSIALLLWLTLSACSMLAPPTTLSPATPTLSPTAAPSPAALAFNTPSSTATTLPNLTPGSSLLLVIFNRSQNRHELHLVDPDTGQDVLGHPPIMLGVNFTRAFSPDGQSLAIVSYTSINCGLNCQPRGVVLHEIDLRTWRDTTTTLPFDGWVYAMHFQPDSTRLVMVFGQAETRAIGIFDLAQHRFTAQTTLNFIPSIVQYTSDGQSLVVYSEPAYDAQTLLSVGPPRVALLNAADFSIQWEQALSDVHQGPFRQQASDGTESDVQWDPAIVLSSNQRTLYIVHADAPKLTTVDFVSRTVRTTDIRPAQSLLERLLSLMARTAYAKERPVGTSKQAILSKDGTRLYVLGLKYDTVRSGNVLLQRTEISLGLQVIDTARAVELARFDSQATQFSLSPDGARLYLRQWRDAGAWTEVLDTDPLKLVERLTDLHVRPTRRLDGQPILISSLSEQLVSRLAVLDPKSLAVIRAWSVNDYAEWVIQP